MKISISRLIFLIGYTLIFVVASSFVAQTYLSSESIKEILFGAMLLLVFVSDVIISVKNISGILDNLYASIHDSKRISFGRVYTIKISAKYIYDNYPDNVDECFVFAKQIFNTAKDYRVRDFTYSVI